MHANENVCSYDEVYFFVNGLEFTSNSEIKGIFTLKATGLNLNGVVLKNGNGLRSEIQVPRRREWNHVYAGSPSISFASPGKNQPPSLVVIIIVAG